MKKLILAIGFVLSLSIAHAGERPTIDKFFDGQRITGVSISPDGRYLALVVTGAGVHYVAVVDRQQKAAPKRVVQLDPKEHSSIERCQWAKADRVLCSIMITTNKTSSRQVSIDGANKYFPSTRLVATDANGENFKVLGNRKAEMVLGFEQLQDRIIDWLPDDPDHVLIQLYDNLGRAVFKLNVRTGMLEDYERSKEYIGSFASDGKGNVRFGLGVRETTLRMFARANGSKSWQEIAKREIDLPNESSLLYPETVIADTNEAYATGNYKGFNALWSVNLTGKSEPQLVYSQPNADVDIVLGRGNELLGVSYNGSNPGNKYVNSNAQQLQEVADKLIPGSKNRLVSFSRNLKIAVVSSQSGKEPRFFSVLDLSAAPAKIERVGNSYPALKGFDLATVEQVSFNAGDGVLVYGFLTKPSGVTDLSKTPLIVLPHGGPELEHIGAEARDYWGFDGWTQFLASRGYAVLQIDFRGPTTFYSSAFKQGYGEWSGKPYSDVIDGTKWALAKGYGDTSRTCIVGASFGGYMALLAATRNHETKLFKCAVSVSGITDLREFLKDQHWWGGWRVMVQSIGTDSDKLRDASPSVHAKEVNIPVMVIHGDQDWAVEVDESRIMASALASADKPHELVIIEGADQYFRDDEYLKAMFTAVDGFLAKQLGGN